MPAREASPHAPDSLEDSEARSTHVDSILAGLVGAVDGIVGSAPGARIKCNMLGGGE